MKAILNEGGRDRVVRMRMCVFLSAVAGAMAIVVLWWVESPAERLLLLAVAAVVGILGGPMLGAVILRPPRLSGVFRIMLPCVGAVAFGIAITLVGVRAHYVRVREDFLSQVRLVRPGMRIEQAAELVRPFIVGWPHGQLLCSSVPTAAKTHLFIVDAVVIPDDDGNVRTVTIFKPDD
ncbi:MAG: hypothetical protein IT281_10345 [Ignavibacteria bacterium]|nr:hypothetical protein [Ignavibacteria bacterium]